MNTNNKQSESEYRRIKKRIFKIIQIGYMGDLPSVIFDVVIAISILANLFLVFFETFDSSKPFLPILGKIELVTVIIFTLEYILRLWTADLLYPNEHVKSHAVFNFVISLYGLVDLFSFLPYWLPVVFPAGIVAFRMLRVVRILRLFRINAYYDAFNVINDVIKEKRSQILSALIIIVMMTLASSLIMYSLEHEAQPEVFANAFSGIWWAVSTLLTVGYGDIYPVTTLGRIVGIMLAFLGVGIVAIPTGIISAGFVEQYGRIKKLSATSEKYPVDFVTINLNEGNPWINCTVSEVELPEELILVTVIRGEKTLLARPSVNLQKGDKLVLGAKALKDSNDFILDETIVRNNNEWIGQKVSKLNIDNDMVIVLIKRGNKNIVPSGNMYVQKDDIVVSYRKMSEL